LDDEADERHGNNQLQTSREEAEGQAGERKRGRNMCREPTSGAELWLLLPSTCDGGKDRRQRIQRTDERKKQKVRQLVDGPEHCIHCDEDPCVFVQIEMRLCENDDIYYDGSDYEKAPVAYNSARRKRAFQYAAFILWEGVNYRKPHYKCVEDGVWAFFPPLDGKIMGFKSR
jgi:hypothetical protein